MISLTWLPAILMLVLLCLRTPITWAMAIAALSFYLLNGNMVPLASFAQEMVEGSQSITLLALPSFVLAGCIMNASGITRRLVRIAEVLVGHLTGALAQMCTVLATLLGGLTASANADAAMRRCGDAAMRRCSPRPWVYRWSNIAIPRPLRL